MKNREKLIRLTYLAVLTALIWVMSLTPIGYLRAGGIEITFLLIPVLLGAYLLGPAGGAFLGLMFGLTSFVQCFGISAFGTTIFNINPFGAAFSCLVPRILMGLVAGLLFRAFSKRDLKGLWSLPVVSLIGALCNTVGFTGSILLFYWKNPTFTEAYGATSILAFLALFITFNALIEAAASTVLTTAIGQAMRTARRK